MIKSTVKIGDKHIPWQEGMTVGDMLEIIGDKSFYPVVRVDKEYVPNHEFNKVLVTDGAEIFLIPMIAGG